MKITKKNISAELFKITKVQNEVNLYRFKMLRLDINSLLKKLNL